MTQIPIFVFLGVNLLELLLVFTKPAPQLRRYVAASLVLLLAASQTAIAWEYPSFAVGAFWLVGVFRIVNMMRLAVARIHPTYLNKAVRRTSLRLLALQTVAAALVWGLQELDKNGLTLALGVALLGHLAILFATVSNTRRKNLPEITKSALGELPTVTVAIPARDETEDLAFCIESILASTYPKLEILVLDDCSQDSTPEVIKSFAHKGVRFIDGEEPETSWLPKNAAYEKLAHEALGEYILFCGVDVRFKEDSVTRILAYTLDHKLDMVGLLPEREVVKPDSLLFQVARYFWELGLPRRILNRPAALSTCFLLNKKALNDIGGFKSVKRSIMPERQFAWEFSKKNSYVFLGNPKPALVSSVKSVSDQASTAVRVRYPQLRKRPENVALYSLLFAGLFVLPFGALVWGSFRPLPIASLVLGAACIVAISLANSLLYGFTASRWRLFGLFSAYPVVLLDFGSLVVSMARYEFGEVTWKGRNICLPIMHAIPNLPKSD